MKVIVKGGNPSPPIKITIPKGSDLSKELPKFIESLDYDKPGLGSCQVGTGKTFGTVHGAVPWAIEHNLKIFYMLNGETREDDPAEWRKIVNSRKFNEKVLIITRVCDTGFGLKDSRLTHVAIFSISPTTLVQVLGRKRRENQEETVNLYVYCPSVDEMKRRLASNIERQEALCSFKEHRAMFLSKYILQPEEIDFRLLINVHKDGTFEPNNLALEYYRNEAAVINKFLKMAKELRDPCCFDRLVCRWFGIKVPSRAESWLNPEISGYGKENFYTFMNEHCDILMDEAEFEVFMKAFPQKCIDAFGKSSNDRLDRKWGSQKFSNKMDELGLPYRLIENKVEKTYIIKEVIPEETYTEEE